MAANLPHPFGGQKIPPPERLDPFQHPIIKAIDALLGSQPGSMDDIFRELRENGFITEEDSDVTQAR